MLRGTARKFELYPYVLRSRHVLAHFLRRFSQHQLLKENMGNRWNSYRVRLKRVSPFLSGYSQTLWIHVNPILSEQPCSSRSITRHVIWHMCLLPPFTRSFFSHLFYHTCPECVWEASALHLCFLSLEIDGSRSIPSILSTSIKINHRITMNNYNKSLRLRDRFLPLAFTAATLSCFKAEGPAGCGIATCHRDLPTCWTLQYCLLFGRLEQAEKGPELSDLMWIIFREECWVEQFCETCLGMLAGHTGNSVCSCMESQSAAQGNHFRCIGQQI